MADEGGNVRFFTSSTASNCTVINNGATVSGGIGGYALLGDSATASSATFINNGATATNGQGGQLVFFLSSSADSATLIANGGTNGGGDGGITFDDDSSGGFARIEIFGNGYLDIRGHNAPGIGTGSIQGSGRVFLGPNNLTVGLNNLSTAFSGVIEDGLPVGQTGGGSLTKLGRGKLTLSHANSYTGGTMLNGGTLLVQNKAGSGTGGGPVQVNNGSLGGTGIISNAVTMGNGTLSGAILLAGNGAKNPGTLTINSALTFHSLAGYTCGLKRTTSTTGQVTAVAGKVSALGVTINSNVPFTFVDSGKGALPVGTVFTVVNNTSGLPISGRFSNLAQGATFTSNEHVQSQLYRWQRRRPHT